MFVWITTDATASSKEPPTVSPSFDTKEKAMAYLPGLIESLVQDEGDAEWTSSRELAELVQGVLADGWLHEWDIRIVLAEQSPRLWIGARVRIAPHTDAWMAGDRYGKVEGLNDDCSVAAVRMDTSGRLLRFHESLLFD